jgi:hypothetical protein
MEMVAGIRYEKLLQECLKEELRIVNSGMPQSRKKLSELLCEARPYVPCHDGSKHFFKKQEIAYLAALLDASEREALLLPVIIMLEVGRGTMLIPCGEGVVEEKIISHVLGMPAACDAGIIRLYRPQLAVIRKKLKTTTQYAFSHSSGVVGV